MKRRKTRAPEVRRETPLRPDREPSPASEPGLSGSVELAIYAVLTGLVWGLFAVDRGLWQDELIALRAIHSATSTGQADLLATIGTSATRRLIFLPHFVAFRFGSPVLALQALYGLVWLGNGWLARSVCLELLPGRRSTAFLAGALAICATSDSLTNSLVSLTYDFSVLYFLGAFLLALRWLRGSRWPALATVPPLLACSYLTTEGALTSMVLAPIVFLVVASGRLTKRLVSLCVVWIATLVPFLWFFLAFLRDPDSYAAVALAPMSLAEQVGRAIRSVAHNFAPWEWVFGRPDLLGARPPTVIPGWVTLLASAVGTALVMVPVLRRGRTAERRPADAPDRLVPWVVLAAALLLVAAANGAFVRVQLAEAFYRTHVMSRIWASVGVAAATAALAALARRRPRLALLIPAVFVALGIGGGIERQDFFLSAWRMHRTELRSVVEEVPRLRDGARMILQMPDSPLFYSLAVPYIARFWLNLVYDDPTMEARSFTVNTDWKTSCSPRDEGFLCEESWASARTEAFVPYSKAVLLEFSPADGRFHLVDELPADSRAWFPKQGTDYRPRLLVERREPALLGRRLLHGPEGLARFLE